MKKSLYPKLVIAITAFFAANHLAAQTAFTYQSPLAEVQQTGFYKIPLPPEIVAKSKEGLPDLRIIDKQGNFVPYVLKNEQPVLTRQNFIEFPILSNEKIKNNTQVEIENNSAQSIGMLLLIIKNNSAYRTATINGSDDRKKWFVIRENVELERIAGDTGSTYIQSIAFVQSNYHFFKVIINDKGLLPVNIIKAGIYINYLISNEQYLLIPGPAFTQKDSINKHSYIQVSFNDKYQVNKLRFTVKNPVLYKRPVEIFIKSPAVPGRILSTEISPSQTAFILPPVKSDSLVIEITNNDNPPLVISEVKAWQLKEYMIAYLQAGNNYSIKTGNTTITAPEYDLKYFTDSLTGSLKEISTGQLSKIMQPAAIQPVVKSTSTAWIWVIIVLVLILLASLSFSMTKAVAKKDANDRI